jgi:hypothetical protein
MRIRPPADALGRHLLRLGDGVEQSLEDARDLDAHVPEQVRLTDLCRLP